MIGDKSRRALELETIIKHLSQYSQTAHGREMCEDISPSDDLSTVDIQLKQTSEMRYLFKIKRTPQLSELPDIRPYYERLGQVGTYLSEEEMLDVLVVLKRARTIREDISSFDEMLIPNLIEFVRPIKPQKRLEKEITEKIDPAGFVKDSASKLLSGIRKGIKSKHDRIYDILGGMLNSRKYSSVIAEDNIVMRNGRFCIPVRTDGLGRIEGIIQGRSGSGATVFLEPYSITDLNNELSSLKEDEASEVRRILIELTKSIGAKLYEIERMEEILSELDLIKARAHLSGDFEGTPPALTQSGEIILIDAYNPLLYILALREDKDPTEEVTPIGFHLGGKVRTVVISGPNAGGKTVTLKTVGSLVYLALCGIHIPAKEGSKIPIPNNMLIDIGEEQSIMESLSSFTAHISRLKEILSEARDNSLVIIDELGIGTDPTYGEALSIAIVDYLTDIGSYNLVTTHYDGLKTYVYNEEGMVNASVEFSEEEHKPTYHLIWDTFGHSHAFDIARELDFPQDILSSALELIDEERVNMEEVLSSLEEERAVVRSLREELERDIELTGEEKNRLEDELASIDKMRKEAKKDANRTARRMIDELREELKSLRKEAERSAEPTIQKGLEKLAEMRDDYPEVRVDTAEEGLIGEIEVGDRVMCREFDFEGKVEEIEDERALVVKGGVRMELELKTLVKVDEDEEVDYNGVTVSGGERATSSINVCGMTVDEALREVDAYIDAGYLSGMPYLEVIHGLGTGRLRDGIREYLRKHSLVESFSRGGPAGGGDGVTIVKFKKKGN